MVKINVLQYIRRMLWVVGWRALGLEGAWAGGRLGWRALGLAPGLLADLWWLQYILRNRELIFEFMISQTDSNLKISHIMRRCDWKFFSIRQPSENFSHHETMRYKSVSLSFRTFQTLCTRLILKVEDSGNGSAQPRLITLLHATFPDSLPRQAGDRDV